jgi:hypothetical protein
MTLLRLGFGVAFAGVLSAQPPPSAVETDMLQVVGRVVEEVGEQRAPYNVVFVSDRLASGKPWIHQLDTDGVGRLAFAVPRAVLASPEAATVGATIFDRGVEVGRFLVPVPSTDAALVLEPRDVVVKGQLRGDEEHPLVQVELIALQEGTEPAAITEAARLADGSFELRTRRISLLRYHRGELLVHARSKVHRDGGVLARMGSTAAALRAGRITVPVDVRLRRVTLEAPNALPPTSVYLYHRLSLGKAIDEHAVAADGEHRVSVTSRRFGPGESNQAVLLLPPAALGLAVIAHGCEPILSTLPSSGDVEVPIPLPGVAARSRLAGTVREAGVHARDLEARIVSCASLSMLGGTPLPTWSSALLDGEGRFELEAVWPDRFEVSLFDGQARMRFPSLVMGPGEEASIDLGKFGCLTLSFEFDPPLEDAAGALQGSVVHASSASLYRFSAHRSPWRTDHLAIGAHHIVVWARPYWIALASVDVKPGDNRARLRLTPGTLFRGTVRDARGAALPGCAVRGRARSSAPWAVDVTDDGGAFELIGPPSIDDLEIELLAVGANEPVVKVLDAISENEVVLE